jgi:hypothetical protein
MVAVQGRGLHLSLPTMRFVLALAAAQARPGRKGGALKLELVDSWDSGALAAGLFAGLVSRRLHGVGFQPGRHVAACCPGLWVLAECHNSSYTYGAMYLTWGVCRHVAALYQLA